MAKSASLEIHQINVSQGDSVLIINRDLGEVESLIAAASEQAPDDKIDYLPFCISKGIGIASSVRQALLIDGGDDTFGGDVYDYLVDVGAIDLSEKIQQNLAILTSHYHDDHQAGLCGLFKERILPTKKGDKPKFKERTLPGTIYQALIDKQTVSRTVCGLRLQSYIKDAKVASPTASTLIPVYPGGRDGKGKMVKISLGTADTGLPITVSLLASGAKVSIKGSKKPITITPKKKKKPDQNDHSLVGVLEYGSFRCYFGGDIGGNGQAGGGNVGKLAYDPAKKHPSSLNHADVETTAGRSLESFFPATEEPEPGKAKFVYPGYCTVMKADHHGSNSSNDVFLMSTLRPLLLVFGAGIKPTPHNHPTQEVIDRASKAKTLQWGLRKDPTDMVDNTIDQLYSTEIAQKTKKYGTSKLNQRTTRILGDIVVRPVDEDVTEIQGADDFGAVLTVQVYGDHAMTILTDTNNTLRPATIVQTDPTKPYYLTGPWEHTDTH